jgi:hypothetical protein
MAVRDQRARHGANGVDVEIGLRAIEAAGREGEEFGKRHSLQHVGQKPLGSMPKGFVIASEAKQSI